ncbi:MAG TPA: organic hydroperoxide resistance protein [Aggregatilineales bacterium]|nr:organic hydroperoxide resistance protein [Aggregatilineales bacterium]
MSEVETKRVNVLYTAEATVTGGRRGHGKTSDGRLEVNFSSPSELGGDGGPGTNPEQLFALGYAACFQNAMMGIARRMNLSAEDSTVTAKVGLGQIGNGRMGLEVELLIHLPSMPDRAQAQNLVAQAHQRCPYSNAVRGNVDVTLTLV